ncbi:formate dehydrogenase subunit delta [Methylobacterium sp. ID0610]|uniref:formate dehydrogenase subunit delta n=1 Tax=Methylobacterium carpenticola TaxID=3344827 RepID=UPI0036775E72
MSGADQTAKLIRMANQIATFFHPYPEEEGVSSVAKHIQDFWTPKMREALAAYCAADGQGLDPLVLKAFGGRDRAEPRAA